MFHRNRFGFCSSLDFIELYHRSIVPIGTSWFESPEANEAQKLYRFWAILATWFDDSFETAKIFIIQKFFAPLRNIWEQLYRGPTIRSQNSGVSGLIGVSRAPFPPLIDHFLRSLDQILFEISGPIFPENGGSDLLDVEFQTIFPK